MSARRTLARPGNDEETSWPAGVRVEYGPGSVDVEGLRSYEVFVDGVSIGEVDQRKSYRGRAGSWMAPGWGWSISFLGSKGGRARDRRRTRTAATAEIVRLYIERQRRR